MLDIGKLGEHLVSSGVIRPEQFAEAKRCVAVRRLSLDQALVLLKYVDFTQLGKCYSEISGLPYVPLLSGRHTEEVRRLLSAECVAEWKILPWAYDPYEDLLTVAVYDPEQIQVLERITRFFMQPYTLAFTIASKAEIEEGIAIHYGVGTPALKDRTEPPLQKAGAVMTAGAGADSQVGRKKIQLLDHSKLTKASGVENAPAAKPVPRRPAGLEKAGPDTKAPPDVMVPGEFSYVAMRGVVRNAASLVVRACLEKNPNLLQEICSRVRYCELLSSRLALPMEQCDAVVLAAWFSGIEDQSALLQQLVTPYKLDELLSCGTRSEGGDRVEARVLSLVKCFQTLSNTGHNSAKDVGLMRKLLRREWSSSPVRQNMLETFLQVLMDEQFLDKIERGAGKILIVDPTEGSTSIMSEPLKKCGYDIQTAATADSAYRLLKTFNPDLILCDRDLPGGGGLAFCEKVKALTETAHMKVVVLLSKKGGAEHAAESLRTGADDFLLKPVDLEVLFLKIRQLMTAEGGEDKEGIRGRLLDMSFADMIQILIAGGKSKEIVLTNGDAEGHVYVNAGEVVHATVGNVVGVDAFAKLMHWTGGEFVMRNCASFPARTINVPTTSLLMQGAKAIDEEGPTEVSRPQPPSNE